MKFNYFEDYKVGEEGETLSRTVGEPDIVSFACLTADYSQVHVARHVMASSPYGERVAHGCLIASLVPGMISYTAPYIVGRDVPEAYYYSFGITHRRATQLGDTIKVKWCVSEKTDDHAQNGFGLVKTAFQVINQEGVATDDGDFVIKVRKEEAKDVRLQLKQGVPWQIKKLILDPEKVYYMEDFVEGEGEEIKGRTMTEADIVNFAGLTGDYDPLYVDAEYARKSPFGERIVPGMMVFFAAFGFWCRDGAYMKAKMPTAIESLAGHMSDGATFMAPVKIGDTIHGQWKLENSRASKSKPEMGIMRMGLQLFNQRNEVVQEGYTVLTRGTKVGVK